MTKSKEQIKIITVGTTEADATTDARIGVVYKKQDGREWVHYKDGYKVIERVNGEAVLRVAAQTPAEVPTT